MTDKRGCIDVLNELLAAEQRSALGRLPESTVFLCGAGARAWQSLQALVREQDEHCRMLVDRIVSLGGAPAPRAADIATADLHYQDLCRLLPYVRRSLEGLVPIYEAARGRLTDEPTAAETVGRILEHHRKGLAEVDALVSATSEAH